MNKTDKSVQQYIERAKDIWNKTNLGVGLNSDRPIQQTTVEIAKMIQLEEHFEAQHFTNKKGKQE